MIIALREPGLDNQVLALDVTKIGEAFLEGVEERQGTTLGATKPIFTTLAVCCASAGASTAHRARTAAAKIDLIGTSCAGVSAAANWANVAQ